MFDINIEIGKKIRNFRKQKKMTLDELAGRLCKSKATVSKYERGEIVLDIPTLYEIATILQIQVDQLLYIDQKPWLNSSQKNKPAFFSGINHFYSYLYDGRSGQVIKSIFDIVPNEESTSNKVYMYMNFKDYDHYQNCENTYCGSIEHYDALTKIVMTNQDTPMEQVTISILASFLESPTKWGLFFGLSSRPMMPIAVKMLFSRKFLKEDEALITQLKVSKEDIRLLRYYNMLSVT